MSTNAKQPAFGPNKRAFNAKQPRAVQVDYVPLMATQNGPFKEEHQVVVTLWDETGDYQRFDGSPKQIQDWAEEILDQLSRKLRNRAEQ